MSQTPRCRPRFKGIESFLRRIAFNLGNTASQTEVKIISCIPIDVTDLQNRICELERELESCSVRCDSNVKHVCHATIVTASPPVFEPPQPYDYEANAEIRGLPELAPSGPSHSEGTPPQVFRNSSRSSARSAPAKELGPEPCNDNAPDEPVATKSKRKISSISHKFVKKVKDKDEDKRPNKRKRKYKKSELVYYVRTETKSPFNQLTEPMDSEQTTYHNRKDDMAVGMDKDYSMYNNYDMSERYVSSMVRKQYEHYPMGAVLSDTSEFSTPVCRDPPRDRGLLRYESDICSCCHGPFHNVDDAMRLPHQHGNLCNVTPIHGMGQYAQQQVTDNSAFYDSSLYDVVPVKEMPTKQRRDENVYVHQESSRFATLDVCPTKGKRTKHRKQHNYHNVVPLRIIPKYYAYRKRNNSKAVPQRTDSLGKLAHLRKTDWKRDTIRPSEISAVDCSPVYTRPIYVANISNKSHINSTPAKIPVQVKNVECLTTNVNNSECQTASTKSVQLEAITIDENKTEVTLNQIKTILQSVLMEVKTSSQLKSPPERIPKKDAIVQKDQSQNNMQSAVAVGGGSNVQAVQNAVSSFMNYSYSPYNLRPYGPSCSRQIPSSQLVPPLSPFQPKCMHNYPLFIQTTGRQCACCFRTIPKGVNTTGSTIVSNAPPPPIRHPPPATIATNTEQQSSRDTHPSSRSPETDKLIQEIYKSIAVNMDYFTKNSTSDYNDLKSSNPSQKTTEIGLPSINERKKQVGLAMVQRQSNVSSSDHTKSVMSPALGSKTTLSTPRRHSHPTQSFIKESSDSMRKELASLRQRGALVIRSTSSQSDSSTATSNASESEKTVAEVRFADQKADKPSLFKKMVNLFSGKKKSSRKEQSDVVCEEEEEEESESDDYQTVCSYKMDKDQHRRSVPAMQYRRIRKPHSKICYSKAPKSRRSPYMEQEYRRDWNERLTFQPDKQIFSSEKPVVARGRRQFY